LLVTRQGLTRRKRVRSVIGGAKKLGSTRAQSLQHTFTPDMVWSHTSRCLGHVEAQGRRLDGGGLLVTCSPSRSSRWPLLADPTAPYDNVFSST
jgi:hypothetical protein